MQAATFTKLNHGWSAEPNDPAERVTVNGDSVQLSFLLNPWAFEAGEGDVGRLLFTGCARWRLGPTNDEGWYRDQCRYSDAAPAWGEFYEILGSDPLVDQPDDWREVQLNAPGSRHFLFYLRDNIFECIASEWFLTTEEDVSPH